MQFRVASGRVHDRTRVPRHAAAAAGLGEARLARSRIAPGRSRSAAASSPVWEINGKTFDPARSDAFPRLDTTETWEIVNRTAVPHMMHMHHTDWYLLARDGRPPPPWEDCLKETFFLHPGERIRVAGHFADYTGKYVIHCHMLDHEDHGLMAQFEVVGRGGRHADGGGRRDRRRSSVATARRVAIRRWPFSRASTPSSTRCASAPRCARRSPPTRPPSRSSPASWRRTWPGRCASASPRSRSELIAQLVPQAPRTGVVAIADPAADRPRGGARRPARRRRWSCSRTRARWATWGPACGSPPPPTRPAC